jgi:tetratricopeptide (TPR) repeat protein
VRATCLWSEQRDLAHDDILSLDRSLALHLTAIFRREIEATEARKALANVGTALDIWGWYHLGLREMYRFSMPGLRAAHQHFERAIALDPEFAAALARLAYVLLQMYWYGPREERAQNLEKGLAAAQQAAVSRSEAPMAISRSAVSALDLWRVHSPPANSRRRSVPTAASAQAHFD